MVAYTAIAVGIEVLEDVVHRRVTDICRQVVFWQSLQLKLPLL